MKIIKGNNKKYGKFNIVPMCHESTNDYATYKSIVTNPHIMKTSSLFKNTIPTEQQALKDFLLKTESHRIFDLGFCKILNADKKVMGIAGFIVLDCEDDLFNVEIGYFLNPEYQGNKLGTDVVKSLVTFAQKNKTIANITASCSMSNIASKKILLKSGFKLIEYTDEVFYFINTLKKPSVKINKICPLTILKEQHRDLLNIRAIS